MMQGSAIDGRYLTSWFKKRHEHKVDSYWDSGKTTLTLSLM